MPCSVKTEAAQLDSYQIQDLGVDWLTCFQAGRRSGDNLQDEGHRIMAEVVSQGNDVRQRSALGFHGKASGGVFVGVRADGYMVQLSGSDARDNWQRVMPYQSNVSRLDLQATVSYTEAQKKIIELAYRATLKAPKKKGRAIEYKLITTSAEGDSLYFGKPQSDITGRMYDKGVESKLEKPGKLVRWEVQMRRDVAKRTAHQLDASKSRSTFVLSHVAAHFNRRSIKTPDFAVEVLEGARVESRSDNASRLAYLRAVTSGTIARVLETYPLEDVLEALGLDRYVISNDNIS